MDKSVAHNNPEILLQEMAFQLTVTRAMLKTVELDQILYIILSGTTHGDGLKCNRALLFLTSERNNELRIYRTAGPANGEEAHRIWENILAEKLDLESLINRYEKGGERFFYQSLSEFSILFKDAKALPSFPTHGDISLYDTIGHCIATQQVILSNNVTIKYHAPHHHHQPNNNHTLEFNHFACVPIHMQDEILGVLLVNNPFNHRDMTENDLRGLRLVANLASIAIERAFLYKKLQRMVRIDGLTGIYNRRYYDQRLLEIYKLSQKLKRNLAMIVFDIDHFKHFNDKHGHICGDQILVEFAQFILQNIRQNDVLARYGGEEFVVLLSGENVDNNVNFIAEKLRKLIEEHSFANFDAGTITVSAGAATIHYNEDIKLLFQRADTALYNANAAGRNCVKQYNN